MVPAEDAAGVDDVGIDPAVIVDVDDAVEVGVAAEGEVNKDGGGVDAASVSGGVSSTIVVLGGSTVVVGGAVATVLVALTDAGNEPVTSA